MKTSLTELARIIRSKNAGPYEITLDIMFKDPAIYTHFRDNALITPALIASCYHMAESDVLGVICFDPANAIKINLRRPHTAGAPGETDVYGAQQHAPLLALAFDLNPLAAQE